MFSRTLIFIGLLVINCLCGYSQLPEPLLQLGFGGNNHDWIISGYPLEDGGQLLTGYSASGNTGDKDAALYGDMDVWVIRTDATGAVVWQQTYGGEKDELLGDVLFESDGTFVLGASSLSLPSGNKTAMRIKWVDYWLVEADLDGNILWQQTYGGDENDVLTCMIETADGGFLLGGNSNSGIYGTKTDTCRGLTDYWIVKLDSLGAVEWEKTLGGSGEENLTSLVQLADGNFIVGGYSFSPVSGEKSEYSSLFNPDWWVIRLSDTGELIWENSIGGSSYDYLYDMYEKEDGIIVLVGSSSSLISGDKTAAKIGGYDGWIVEINEDGDVLQDVVIGGVYDDEIKQMEVDDSTYIFVCQSTSVPGFDKTAPAYGNFDAWIVFTDLAYDVISDIAVGGSMADYPVSMEMNDGRWGISCFSYSGISGNKTVSNQGGGDYWYFEIPTCLPLITVYLDDDGDSYGGADSILTTLCDMQEGYVFIGGDCDDSNSDIHPSALEICNGLDDNCNGDVDDGILFFTIYQDLDEDGFGNADSSLWSCYLPDGYVINGIDCDDNNALIHNLQAYYVDMDGDGLGGEESAFFCSLLPPFGYADNSDDCDDTTPGLGALNLFYVDNDDDGYGQPGTAIYFCAFEVPGFVTNADDCNDTDPSVNPAAEEVLNGLDDNCNYEADEGLVGVEQQEISPIQLFPNPVTHTLTVQLPENYGPDAPYTILDIRGAIIATGHLHRPFHQFNLIDCPDGVYVINVYIADHLYSHLFIIE